MEATAQHMRRRNAGWLAATMALLLAAGVAQAVTYEYPRLYKDPRALGMGGAGLAVTRGAQGLLSNPATLAGAPRGARTEIPLSLGLGDRVYGFHRELRGALSIDDQIEQYEAVNNVLREYRGHNLHAEAAAFPTVSWRTPRNLTLAAGVLAASKVDARAHQGFGSEGLLEVDWYRLYGPVLGLAHAGNRLDTGAAIKVLNKRSLQRTYSVREIIEVRSGDNGLRFSDDIVEGNAIGIDLGLRYRLAPQDPLRPSLALSLLNVGDMNFHESGVVPMTANLGAAIQPDVPYLGGLTVAVDYRDALGAYPQDQDKRKRLHLGAEAELWRSGRSAFAVRTGLHQGYATAGVELQASVLRLGLATYAEEVGAYGGQDRDRRYVAHIGIDW
jgi:hypothetical protein